MQNGYIGASLEAVKAEECGGIHATAGGECAVMICVCMCAGGRLGENRNISQLIDRNTTFPPNRWQGT